MTKTYNDVEAVTRLLEEVKNTKVFFRFFVCIPQIASFKSFLDTDKLGNNVCGIDDQPCIPV